MLNHEIDETPSPVDPESNFYERMATKSRKKPSAAEPQPIGKNDDEEPRKAGIGDSVTVERGKFR